MRSRGQASAPINARHCTEKQVLEEFRKSVTGRRAEMAAAAPAAVSANEKLLLRLLLANPEAPDALVPGLKTIAAMAQSEGSIGIRRKPVFERVPVQRLVPIPVVGRRIDQRVECEPRCVEALNRLRQRHVPTVGDVVGQRPASPVRLADDDVAAFAGGGHERSERTGQIAPHEARAEAHCDVVARRFDLEYAAICLPRGGAWQISSAGTLGAPLDPTDLSAAFGRASSALEFDAESRA